MTSGVARACEDWTRGRVTETHLAKEKDPECSDNEQLAPIALCSLSAITARGS